MEKERELMNVPGLNSEDKVVIKRLNFGQRNKLIGLSAKVKLIKNSEEIGDMDIEKYKLYSLVFGIKSASFYKYDVLEKDIEQRKIEAINNLEQETGEYIFSQISELNTPIEAGEKK